MIVNVGRFAFTLLTIGTMTGALSAQSVELASRVHPSQTSDTATGFLESLSEIPESGESPPRSLSDDGRYVVFTSLATNLVPGQQDMNAAPDVFLRDLVTGTTVLVSHSMGSAGKAPGPSH